MTRLAVIGQGKLGFPVACYYASKGVEVVGVDVAEGVVAAINAGRSPIGHEPGASESVADLVSNGLLRATTSYDEGISGADVVIILVPLLALDGVVDYSTLDRATELIAAGIEDGATVIFETTLPIGATRDRFAPRLTGDGNRVHVAFSPERVSSGRVWRDLDTYPKLVGGVDGESTRMAAAFYRAHLPAEVRELASAETAEMVKLAETTYRDLNIAFANELARMADARNIDITEVIPAANSQPYSHIHQPGVGVGGHCIPHYPYLLQESTIGSELVAIGRRVNESMPDWVVSRLAAETDLAGAVVLLRGVAYRGGVKETISSPSLRVADVLNGLGAKVLAEDPCFSPDELEALGLRPWRGETVDVTIVATDHVEYREIDWSSHPGSLVVDGRNTLDRAAVESAGHRYLGVGRP